MTTRPQNTSELFDAATRMSKETAKLLIDGWAIGVRDGLHTAAGAIDDTVRDYRDILPSGVEELLVSMATTLRLSALSVGDSDPPRPGPIRDPEGWQDA